MEILLAKNAGFCFGVRRAVETAKSAVKEKRSKDPGAVVYTYGELIHNRTVVEELRKEGIVPIDSLESIKEFAPISFSVSEISKDLSKLKIKTLECDKTDTELRLYDGSDISVKIDRCNERLHTSEFVEFIWSRIDTYNFTELSQSEIDKLKDGQLVALPAFFRDENKAPLKILISGREFAFAKALESISIAAVEKETEYQQNLDHSHVVIRIEYDSVVIFMLCGVV